MVCACNVCNSGRHVLKGRGLAVELYCQGGMKPERRVGATFIFPIPPRSSLLFSVTFEKTLYTTYPNQSQWYL
jgi:hypothetical protein